MGSSEGSIARAGLLDTPSLVHLQLVSHRFFALFRDSKLWKIYAFEKSQPEQHYASGGFMRRRGGSLPLHANAKEGEAVNPNPRPNAEMHSYNRVANERVRAMANWDLSYPAEKVDWYEEYKQRYAQISFSWLQQPISRIGHSRHQWEPRDVLGMGLFEDTDPGGAGSLLVAPLDDGSVCLWDINDGGHGRDRDRMGKIIARSKAGLLSVNGPYNPGDSQGEMSASGATKANMTNTGVVECVSVDSARKRAYFAVQSGLTEVDLETLQAVSHERFPFSISALSEAQHPTPLTVGTTLSLHLHDPRMSQNLSSTSNGSNMTTDRCETVVVSSPGSTRRNDFHRLLTGDQHLDYAPLFQPGPLSILHLPPFTSSSSWDGNGSIYVAGRFSSILNYDRRTFPKLRGHLHSGASLCSLTSLPHPFASLESDLMRHNQLSIDAVNETKSLPGQTLIACGEYNTKGSLELYGLSSLPQYNNNSSDSYAGRQQTSTYKNRQSASSSKLLSVANHGTRLVFSDGNGTLKWVERDGSTEVRTWNINHRKDEEAEIGSADVIRKILAAPGISNGDRLGQKNLLLWTGERIGYLNFEINPAFTAKDSEEYARPETESLNLKEERRYGDAMRRALERQANEVKFVRGLGF
ncbi:MAG: hypothetical protein M1819_000756 [Sarea resinae]|nr:MAG: hypothetical protein M1819_000756 [Sarea resinae]